ncbi:Protein-L-isoaspartate O-methyltransferase [Actinopolyspora alba]|uniref:Protein-L-isoaspartate O-methyltransferase n=1 Tax=Actinopolyspora alba TaxID=673379 RepID=A0A1I1ZMT8_9ACTN|nr:methyltransferase domain-containing protein [Actinopolyspora alba]SFE33006.1 Protein-L-isoaspartate O-methyltransferase [Actinopolyspora alba]
MTDTAHAHSLRQRLTDELRRSGNPHSTRWENAFRNVPRERFVSRFTVPTPDGLIEYDVHGPNANQALAAVYSDSTLITRWDSAGTAISSSTTPSLMALMLEQLDAAPGHTVLEVGTGTGYNAALLSTTLGDEAVTTIDVDPVVIENARAALRETGYAPTVIRGDGAHGVPARAPFDRILATCGAHRIPAEWLRQLRPGGILLVNLSFALVRLEVDEHGHAHGPFTDTAAFMTMRHDPNTTEPTARDVLARTSGEPSTTRTAAPLPELAEPSVIFLRALLYPRLRQLTFDHDSGTEQRLYDTETGAWARARRNGADSVTLEQHGSRDLWSELTELVTEWHECGRPEPHHHGLHVTPDGTHILRVDTPTGAVTVREF